MTPEPAHGPLASVPPVRRGFGVIVLACAGVLLGSMLLAVMVGSVHVAPGAIVDVLLAHAGGREVADAVTDAIVWRVRIPRVVTAAVVGATLALAGSGYQGVFRNPLADPYLLGVASGAALGAVVALTLPFGGFGMLPPFAFAGAMLAVATSYELARVGRSVLPTSLVLAGVAVSSAASAGSSLLMLLSGDRLLVVFAWLFGDFASASWHRLLLVLPYLVVSGAILLWSARSLNVLQVGDEEARALGLRVERTRLLVTIAASLGAAICVALSGVIGFVGLVVPHIARLIVGTDFRQRMPVSLLLGGAVVVLADVGARTVIAPQELPVGIVTAAAGAPFFLLLLRRERMRSES